MADKHLKWVIVALLGCLLVAGRFNIFLPDSFLALGVLFVIPFYAYFTRRRLKVLLADKPDPGDHSNGLIFLVSMAALFTELILIRWLGTEIRIFAYVQNLVLVACFLGFGAGCFRSGKPVSLLPALEKIALLTLIVAMPWNLWHVVLIHLSNLLSLTPDTGLWGSSYNYTAPMFATLCVLAIVMVAALLWLIASAMAPFGQWIGYCFDHSKNTVRSYSVNLAGSLIGSWLLVLLSFMGFPPALWISLAFVMVLLATFRSRRNWIEGLILLVPVVFLMQNHGQVSWSPYQKLSITPFPGDAGYYVEVNNGGYMNMSNVSPQYLKQHPDLASRYRDSVYDTPFRFVKKGARVLIVGAGAGNDAAGALRNGASHVDAVEIDPVIYRLGREHHPDHPYDSAKVNVIVNDARNFLRETHNQYDAIIFGLLDSQTQSSGYTNLRVDNYVYTRESFAQARRLLKPDGVLILKFEVRDPWTWIGQRFYRTLSEVFQREPVTYYVPIIANLNSGTVFLESNDPDLWKRTERPELAAFLKSHPPAFRPDAAAAPEPATDDWPYPYTLSHSIPRTYFTVSLILLIIAYAMVRKDFAVKSGNRRVMLLLGAGFMLMETQMVSRLALYFGTTWIVNSIAVSLILAVLVLANLCVERMKKPSRWLRPLYIGAIVSLAVNYIMPWESFGLSSWLTGTLLAGAYAITVFIAGIIFTTTFRDAKVKSGALGANVLGAVIGGVAQNLSFIFGLKALLLVAGLCYAGAGLARERG